MKTIEEYFLDNIKNVLQFGNDVQATRFMEKYFEQKCWQEGRSYSEKKVIEIIKKFDNNNNLRGNIDKWFKQYKESTL